MRLGKVLYSIEDPGLATAQMIADACTTPTPTVRWPLQVQTYIDGVRALSDDDYLKLCAGHQVKDILTENHALNTGWRVRSHDELAGSS